MPLQVPREAAQLLLAKQSTLFAWRFFDKNPTKQDVKRWAHQFHEFYRGTHKLAYPPNARAMAKIAEWLEHEQQGQIKRGRPVNSLDEIILSWLIAFFTECFEPTGKVAAHSSQCIDFTKLYLVELQQSIRQVDIVDPQGQGRQLRTEWLSPAMREDDAYRKAIARFRDKADLERAKIRAGLHL